MSLRHCERRVPRRSMALRRQFSELARVTPLPSSAGGAVDFPASSPGVASDQVTLAPLFQFSMIPRDQVGMSLATPGNVQFQAVDDLLVSRRLGRQGPRSQGIKVDRDQGTKAPQRPAPAAEKSVWLEPDSSGLPVRLKPDLREGPRSQARSRLQLTWESSSSRHHHHPGTKAYWHREHLGTQPIQGPSRPRFPAFLVPRTHRNPARRGARIVKDPRRIGPWPTWGSSFPTGQGIELS